MNRPLNRPMITLSIMLATILQTLDSTIANVALPHMQGSLSASQDQIAWVLTAYIVAAAIATPLTGWLVDRFGQKNILLGFIQPMDFIDKENMGQAPHADVQPRSFQHLAYLFYSGGHRGQGIKRTVGELSHHHGE